VTVSAYPLQWPTGWKRTPALAKKPGKFHRQAKGGGPGSWRKHEALTISQATQRVLAELQRMGVHRDDAVISTNLLLRLDGLPRSAQARPSDPGVAVYWQDSGARRVMAIDQYETVEDNLAAIAATLDAMRAIERHGGAVILERAFTGFLALPAPAARAWWQVLGVAAHAGTVDVIDAYRRLRSEAHRAGDTDRFDAVNRAYARFQDERGLA